MLPKRETMNTDQDVSLSKVKDLSPASKQANLVAKIVEMGEKRRIDSKFGGSRDLCEAVVGDETGTIVLTLWDAQIGQVGPGDVLQVNNGYVSLVRGHMRLNVGKYGTFQKVEVEIPDVKTDNDLSAKEHERPRRESPGGYGGGRPRGERRDRGRRRF